MEQQYICLTGDIIGSKNSREVKALNNLQAILKEMNSHLHPLAPMRIASGDEFQGLLSPKQNPFDFIDYLEYRLFPLRFRMGIGIGTIATALHRSTQTMRGPVFEFARQAIEQAKIDNRYYAIKSSANTDLLDAILKLLSYIKGQWTNPMVFRRYFLYHEHETASKVAKLEKVSVVAANKFILKYGFREIRAVTLDFCNSVQSV